MRRAGTGRLLKKPLAGGSKRSRGEARDESTSGGVHRRYVDARRLRQRSIWVFFSRLLGLVSRQMIQGAKYFIELLEGRLRQGRLQNRRDVFFQVSRITGSK